MPKSSPAIVKTSPQAMPQPYRGKEKKIVSTDTIIKPIPEFFLSAYQNPNTSNKPKKQKRRVLGIVEVGQVPVAYSLLASAELLHSKNITIPSNQVFLMLFPSE
ncbi:MAG: hypothetical protein NTY03_05215 [Candidatus Bathyarchaeota archaeon]|nr:hypothetical protein [Candidatus Bathyarchaeota archaeon]